MQRNSQGAHGQAVGAVAGRQGAGQLPPMRSVLPQQALKALRVSGHLVFRLTGCPASPHRWPLALT